MPVVTIERPAGASPPLRAYLALPERSSPSPGVVIIHEIGGLDEHTRRVAERFARDGYPLAAADAWGRTVDFFKANLA